MAKQTKKTPKTPVVKTETPVVSGAGSEAVVEGLAEIDKAEKIAKLRELEAAKKAKGRVSKKAQKRIAKLRDFASGTNESGDNPRFHHNPSLLPETLRAAHEGEQINGHDAKGWVVTIRCQHLVTVPETDENGDKTEGFVKVICGTDRLINTQDAFQTRFCEEHKGEAQKIASKGRRLAKKDAELAKLDSAELDAQIAALEADLAA